MASSEAPNGLDLDAVVEVIERLGSQILLDVKVGGGSMVAAVEPTVRAKVREQLRLALNPDRLHFFELTDGSRDLDPESVEGTDVLVFHFAADRSHRR